MSSANRTARQRIFDAVLNRGPGYDLMPATEATDQSRLAEELEGLRREVAAARKYAEEMRDFCSPHGVSVHYADQLVQAMDRAKEGRP